MGEFNEMFPKPVKSMGVKSTNLNNWRCKPMLWPLLDGYLEWVRQEVGDINPPRTEWYAAARELREELYRYHVPEAEWKQFVLWACAQMKKKELFNKNHRSIKFLVPQWNKRKKPEDRQKYLKWVD